MKISVEFNGQFCRWTSLGSLWRGTCIPSRGHCSVVCRRVKRLKVLWPVADVTGHWRGDLLDSHRRPVSFLDDQLGLAQALLGIPCTQSGGTSPSLESTDISSNTGVKQTSDFGLWEKTKTLNPWQLCCRLNELEYDKQHWYVSC